MLLDSIDRVWRPCLSCGPIVLASLLLGVAQETLAADQLIRTVDFGNTSVPWEARPHVPDQWKWLSTLPTGQLQLQGGRGTPGKGDYVALQRVIYADLMGDGRDEAIVEFRYGTGGSATWSYLHVFTERGGRAECIAVMRAGSRADGGLLKLLVRGRKLEIHFQDTSRRFADCCSDGAITATYRWDGQTFVETGRRRLYVLKGKNR